MQDSDTYVKDEAAMEVLTNNNGIFPEGDSVKVLFHNCFLRDGAPLFLQGEMPDSTKAGCSDFPLCTAILIKKEHADALGIPTGARHRCAGARELPYA